jgi:hypothetical protein
MPPFSRQELCDFFHKLTFQPRPPDTNYNGTFCILERYNQKISQEKGRHREQKLAVAPAEMKTVGEPI